jgi:hypothetical protein
VQKELVGMTTRTEQLIIEVMAHMGIPSREEIPEEGVQPLGIYDWGVTRSLVFGWNGYPISHDYVDFQGKRYHCFRGNVVVIEVLPLPAG